MALRFSPNTRRRNTLGLRTRLRRQRRFHRLGKPSLEQPPTDLSELSPQIKICHRISWNRSERQRPSVDRRGRQAEPQCKRTLRQPERLQFGAKLVARHRARYRTRNHKVKPEYAPNGYQPPRIYAQRVFYAFWPS